MTMTSEQTYEYEFMTTHGAHVALAVTPTRLTVEQTAEVVRAVREVAHAIAGGLVDYGTIREVEATLGDFAEALRELEVGVGALQKADPFTVRRQLPTMLQAVTEMRKNLGAIQSSLAVAVARTHD